MPPSVDSTCTPTPCVTRSSPRKRNSCSPKAEPTKDVRKKSRGASSLSETSPPRSGENLDGVGQVTQESQQRRSSPDIDTYICADLPPGRRQEEYVSLAQQNDGFLKRGKFRKVGSRALTENVDGCIRSMILHSGTLARSILAAYEKEKEHTNREISSITRELAQLRTFSEAAAAELPQLRAFHESATIELANRRKYNEAAAVTVANLRLKNANLARKEASISSKLEKLQRQCAMRNAVNIVAAFIMSKALMLQDAARLNETTSSEIDQLKFENAQMSKAITEMEEQGRLQILNLQLSLEAANKELAKLSSEKAELAKEKDDRDAAARSETRDLLCRLAAVNEEVNRLHSNTEALLREKDDAAARAAHAAAVELDKMKSRNETLSTEMQTALQMTGAEMKKMQLTVESTTGNLRKLFLEKQEIAREKAESEARKTMEIAQLLSEKAALVAEKEKTNARVAHEFQKLSSRFEGAVEKLKVVRKETGLEKAKLKSEMAAKNLELEGLEKILIEVQADTASKDARRAAEMLRLMKENDNSHAREIALLEKLQSMKVSPRERSDMHIAFLMNWGLLRPDEHSFN